MCGPSLKEVIDRTVDAWADNKHVEVLAADARRLVDELVVSVRAFTKKALE